MLVKHSRQHDGPITVDAAFLGAIQNVIAEAQQIARKHVADEYKLTLENISAFEAGEQGDGTTDYRKDTVLRDIRSKSACKISLAFTNGKAIEISDVAQINSIFQAEPGNPKSISVEVGGYSAPNLKVTVGSDWSSKSISYSIEGREADVNHLSAILDRLIENSRTSGFALTGKWMPRILAFVIWLTITAIYVLAIGRINRQSYEFIFQVAAQSTVPVAVIVGFFCALVIDKYREVFPNLSFELGRGWKRNEARRAFLFWIVSSALIPIILLIISEMLK